MPSCQHTVYILVVLRRKQVMIRSKCHQYSECQAESDKRAQGPVASESFMIVDRRGGDAFFFSRIQVQVASENRILPSR
jgi:hypothetical protein